MPLHMRLYQKTHALIQDIDFEEERNNNLYDTSSVVILIVVARSMMTRVSITKNFIDVTNDSISYEKQNSLTCKPHQE